MILYKLKKNKIGK